MLKYSCPHSRLSWPSKNPMDSVHLQKREWCFWLVLLKDLARISRSRPRDHRFSRQFRVFQCLRKCKKSWNRRFPYKIRHCRDAQSQRKMSIFKASNYRLVRFPSKNDKKSSIILDFLYVGPSALQKILLTIVLIFLWYSCFEFNLLLWNHSKTINYILLNWNV